VDEGHHGRDQAELDDAVDGGEEKNEADQPEEGSAREGEGHVGLDR
jgi:hypothetical protein